MLLPPGKRRSLFDYKIVAAYLMGTTSGALLTAMIAWVLSGFTEPLHDSLRIVLLGLGAIFIWLCKQGPLANVIDLPETRRQIPAEIFGGSLVHGAYRFGFELGTGVRTYVPSSAPYILLLVVLLARPTLATAILIGLGFGLGRAVPLMVAMSVTGPPRLKHEVLQGIDYFATTVASVLVLAGALSLV